MRLIATIASILMCCTAIAQNIVSVEIVGESMMTFGKDPDTAFDNKYAVVLKDKKGAVIEASKLPKGYSVTWDIDGFKTENDQKGQYCDSYGSFVTNEKSSLETVFALRNVPMNFIGNMSVIVKIGDKSYRGTKYVAALAMPQEKKAEVDGGNGVKVEIGAETGSIYNVTVVYQGVLMTGYINEDLSGYELGKQEGMDTAKYEVPCVNGKIDLWATGENGSMPAISYVNIEKQSPKQARAKRATLHIGDSTSANRGSWAYQLAKSMKDGEPQELAEQCDFKNFGAGGRNLRTYYIQGRLAKVLLDIHPGDIFMMGNNGTNGMNKTFEEDENYYLDIAEAFGAQTILNSYTPHGTVARWSNMYNAETQTFDSYRRDAYDETTRKIAEERAQKDEAYIGFVEIGKNADKIFNQYVNDYAKNGYSSRAEAAEAIIKCFKDHNHYDVDTLACELMLNGYGDVDGIVKQIIKLLKQKE